MLVVLPEGWQDGLAYHPDPKSCSETATIRSSDVEQVADTLARAGYCVLVARTITGRDVQCTPQEHAPSGDWPTFTWHGPAWSVQKKNDNYWCVGPTLLSALSRAGWRDSELVAP